jgi:hypothetical protein
MTSLGPRAKVKCIMPDGYPYVSQRSGEPRCGPSYGSLWTVLGIDEWCGEIYVQLAEWGNADHFKARYFIPLDGNAEIEKLRALAALAARPALIPGVAA